MDHKRKKAAVNEPQYVCGIAGGIGGTGFGDYYHAGYIVQINVTYGAYINTIEVVWGDGSPPIKHGGRGGDGPTARSFFLEPEELLTGIAGTLSTYDDNGPYVGSIMFLTSNGRTSDEYGTAYAGNTWSFNAPITATNCAGQAVTIRFVIAGFCGRAGKYLDAIGVVLEQV